MDAEDVNLETLIEEFRSGARTAQAIALECLEQWRCWPGLGAVTWIDEGRVLEDACQLDRDRAAGRPARRLGGLPFVAKDNIDTVGFPTTAGAATLANLRPNADAILVRELLERGAILFGKANMHELACGGTTTNPTYGTTRNPYAWDRVPGGSSGGSGAVVAAGIVPLSLGSDTAGSVRIPAAYCGVAGLRPTVYSRAEKAYSSAGLLPFACDLDTIGPLARSVAELAHFDALLRDYAVLPVPDAAELRIGMPRQYYWEDLEPSVHDVTCTAVARLRECGVAIIDVDVSGYVHDAAAGFSVLCFDGGLRTDLAAHLADYDVSSDGVLKGIRARDVRHLIEQALASARRQEAIEQARRQRLSAREAYGAVFREHRLDAMMFPTVPILPPKINECGDPPESTTAIGGKVLSTNGLMIRNTMTTSFIGAPGLSLSCGATGSGLPVGMELDALPGQDAKVLAVGRTAERVWGRLPPPQRRMTGASLRVDDRGTAGG